VGIDWGFVSRAQAAARRTGSALGVEPAVRGRHSLGVAHRSSVARPARRVSQRGNLLATSATVGRRGCLVGGVAAVAGRSESAATAGMGRNLSGWQLRVRQKRGAAVGKTKRGKGTKWMVLVDGQGIPLGAQLASASPAEVTLAEATIAAVRVPCWGRGRPRQKPKRVIADRAYDSNPLRDRLHKRGIELLVPHRRNRQRWWRQDGRKLRRYRRRWKVERTFAWLQNFRRLLVRQDRILAVYRGLFHFACLLITLRYL